MKIKMEKNNAPLFDEAVDLVKFQFTDVFGQNKVVEMTKNQAERAVREGYPINRFALGGLKKGETDSESAPDYLTDRQEQTQLYLKPDLHTYALLPWEGAGSHTARLICNICGPDGAFSGLDSRYLLQRQVERAGEMGLAVEFDFQCEFYLFHTDDNGRPTTITHEVASYYDAGPIDLAENVRRDMLMNLEEAGMEAESARHGLTPGQHSFRLPPRRGVEAGDYLQTFKTAVKRIAKRHGLHATFMPKPNMSGDGSGLHVGMTIRRTDGSDAGEAAARFRVGILKNLYNMMIFTNPMINSYKRLAASRGSVFQPEFPAAAWEKGSDKAVRLTGCSERGASLEALFPDPAANPYLALAAILSAGLNGLENGCELTQYEADPRFPETLGVLIRQLPDNSFARRTFGDKLCRVYHEGKKEEWERFCSYVTDWELAEYLYRC